MCHPPSLCAVTHINEALQWLHLMFRITINLIGLAGRNIASHHLNWDAKLNNAGDQRRFKQISAKPEKLTFPILYVLWRELYILCNFLELSFRYCISKTYILYKYCINWHYVSHFWRYYIFINHTYILQRQDLNIWLCEDTFLNCKCFPDVLSFLLNLHLSEKWDMHFLI